VYSTVFASAAGRQATVNLIAHFVVLTQNFSRARRASNGVRAASSRVRGTDQLLLSSTILDEFAPYVVIDVEIAGHPARALVDTGAHACFVSDAFCSKTLLRYDRSKYASASLANKSTAGIRGATAPVSLFIQSFIHRARCPSSPRQPRWCGRYPWAQLLASPQYLGSS
jgi:predicted aspartyl protease